MRGVQETGVRFGMTNLEHLIDIDSPSCLCALCDNGVEIGQGMLVDAHGQIYLVHKICADAAEALAEV